MDPVVVEASSPPPPALLRSGACSEAVDLAFELGWDYAQHGLAPPPERLERLERSRGLEQGYRAGRALFGSRMLPASRFVRKWLQLRLGALERGRFFDEAQVTPAYLEAIDVAHCPILRHPLSHQCQQPSDWSVDRVDNRAGYVAGNLAVIGVRANKAKRDLGFREALSFTRQSEVLGAFAGLETAQWARLAVLASFVETLEPDEAAALPMLVLPPPGLALANPLQRLQAWVSRAALGPDYARRIARLRSAVPGKALRRDFDTFENTWRARVIGLARRKADVPPQWLLEDAWQCRLLAQRWRRFARGLGDRGARELIEDTHGGRALPRTGPRPGRAIRGAGLALSAGGASGAARRARAAPRP